LKYLISKDIVKCDKCKGVNIRMKVFPLGNSKLVCNDCGHERKRTEAVEWEIENQILTNI
jgi:hypothetical protein